MLLPLLLLTLADQVYEPAGFLRLPPNVELGALSAVAVDRQDNVYVLHRGPQPVLKFDKRGRFVKGWGEGLFKVAHGLRIDRAGNVWTTDNGNHLLRKFSPSGQLLHSIGEGILRAPDDLVFASDGTLFVADSGHARIAHLSADGQLLGSFGRKGKGDGEFATAHALAIDSQDRIYVADRGNERVQVFAKDGTLAGVWRGFGQPFGLLVTGNEELIVSDGDAHRIAQLRLTDGSVIRQWGGPESLQLPHLMSSDSRGRLYIAEVNGKRVQIFPARPRGAAGSRNVTLISGVI